MPNHKLPIAQELLCHQVFLRRLAIALVGSDADDLVQEVWQKALEHPPSHDRQLRGWLARVARNLAAKRWRGEAHRAEREARWASEQPARSELDARFELRKELVATLDSLHPSIRETILLRYFEDLAPRHIAKHQGVPLATVKTRLRRGLHQLREMLDRRHGGDRASWMPAVTALATPVGSGVATSTLVIGGIAMGTIAKMSAAILVVATGLYFVVHIPSTGSPQMAAVEQPWEDGEVVDPETTPDLSAVPVRRNSTMDNPSQSDLAKERPVEEPTGTGKNVLRLVLEGVSEEDARMATVVLMGLDQRDGWPTETGHRWSCKGRKSEFDLDSVLASLDGHTDLQASELEVAVVHPHHLGGRSRISLKGAGDSAEGRRVHEVRMRLVRPEFWPEFTLDVRDANTKEHLKNVELRIASGPAMAVWGRNGMSTVLADGLDSPIALMGGREPNTPVATVAGVSLSPAAGESPRLVALKRRSRPEGGVRVTARAPGYARGSISVDVSKGKRELFLEPAGALKLRLANVQLERYAALDTEAMLCVYWIREDGGNQYVHFERLDQVLEGQGLLLESLVPGGYRLAVELGGGSWTEQPVLALEEVFLAAGETRELMLSLLDPPEPPALATFDGVVSFPAFGSEEDVRLQVYFQPTQRWREPDFEFPMADLPRVGGALPTWSFRLEDQPVGRYRIQLLPFLKVWMIDLPEEGRENLELVVPELAEVLVETVDGRTGERVPRDDLYYRIHELVEGQRQNDFTKAVTEEPGRFRFWAPPGAVMVWPKYPTGPDRGAGNGEIVDLIPGRQSVRLELEPTYAMRFEFREGGVAWPVGDPGMFVMKNIRAVGHDGHVTRDGLQRNMQVEVSQPGFYEISFEDIDPDRYHPIPARRVEVRAGEVIDVIVELSRK